MYRVELYAQVRRSVFVEGLSKREAAKRFGLARGTVRKMLRYATPPGYRRRQPAQRPKLDPFTGIVDQILIDDQERPKKQRHTAKRIFDRLRDEYDFTGGYTIVKDSVRDKKLGGQEMFVPLVHPPGDAQADFGEALVVIDGVQRKAHYLVVDLPHSDDAFVKAFPAYFVFHLHSHEVKIGRGAVRLLRVGLNPQNDAGDLQFTPRAADDQERADESVKHRAARRCPSLPSRLEP